jgi:hypothetical protein
MKLRVLVLSEDATLLNELWVWPTDRDWGDLARHPSDNRRAVFGCWVEETLSLRFETEEPT